MNRESGLERSLKKHPYLIFTIVFLFCSVFTFGLILFVKGDSLILGGDAAGQHYPSLIYYSSWLRELFRNIFVEHNFSIPQWDLSIGYGRDVLTTIHYYVLGDPLTLFCVFFPPEKIEYFYDFLVVFRLYLAGLACTAFLRTRKFSGTGVLLAAIVYVFSGYAMNPGIFHPFFSIPMIYFPLLLIGVEKMYQKKSPWVLVFSVFLSAVSNLYFFYMECIFVILYACLRYFSYFPVFRVKECLAWILRFVAFALLGCMLASPIILPNLFTILFSERMSVERELLSWYPQSYYRMMPASLIANFSSYYFYVAVAAVAVVLLMILLSAPLRKYLVEKCLFLVFICIAAVPLLGSAMNGFTYATNRWIWAFILFLSWCCARIYPELRRISGRHLLRAVILCVLFCIACVVPRSCREAKTFAALGILLLILLLVILYHRVKRFPSAVFAYGMVAVTVLNIIVNTAVLYRPFDAEASSGFLPSGNAYASVRPDVLNTIAELPDTELSRFETEALNQGNNSAMLYGLNGVDYYYSAIDSGTVSFQKSVWLNMCVEQKYASLDNRACLDYAMGVKYFASPKNQPELIPYGYTQMVGQTDTYQIYTSENALPLVYIYQYACTGSDSWTPFMHQQALLQCAVVEQPCSIPEKEPVFSDRNVSYTVNSEGTIGVSVQDGYLDVTQDGAVLQLDFEDAAACELYVCFENLEYQQKDPVNTTVGIRVSSGSLTKTVFNATPLDNYYCGYQNYAVNLGYSEAARNSVRITFVHKGKYSCDSLRIVCQPMEQVDLYAAALRNSGVKDIACQDNGYCFTTERDSAGMACVAIPYSKGWTAFLDNEAVEILPINSGLCGIEIPAGTHTVTMKYQTPYFKLGCILNLLGLGVLVCCGLVFRKRQTSVSSDDDQDKEGTSTR